MKRPASGLVESSLFHGFCLEKNPIQYKSGRRRQNLASAQVWRYQQPFSYFERSLVNAVTQKYGPPKPA